MQKQDIAEPAPCVHCTHCLHRHRTVPSKGQIDVVSPSDWVSAWLLQCLQYKVLASLLDDIHRSKNRLLWLSFDHLDTTLSTSSINMPPSHEPQRPYTPLPASREDSVTPPDYKPDSSPSRMFTIQSMLNPQASDTSQALHEPESNSRSATPTSATPVLTVSSTTRSTTPGTPSSTKGKKTTKKTAILNRGSPTGQVNYPPYELTGESIGIADDDQEELIHQHRLFRVKPSVCDGEGLIWGGTRFIPYSSHKKNFFNKTSKEGFSGESGNTLIVFNTNTTAVFQYTFQVPNDPAETEYTVMWDCDNGLTRITPFFKACNHSKVFTHCPLIPYNIYTDSSNNIDRPSQSSIHQSRPQRTRPFHHRRIPHSSRLLGPICLRSCNLSHILLQHPLGSDAYLRSQLSERMSATNALQLSTLQDRLRDGALCNTGSRRLEAVCHARKLPS